jgi:ZIP family zinc transporter
LVSAAIGFSAGIMLLISFLELVPEPLGESGALSPLSAVALGMPIVTVRKQRFVYVAAFLSSLAEPLGALIGLAAVQVYPGLNPLFMAFAAGAMIFVSVHELLPMARRYGNIGLFMTGGIASVFVYFVLDALV